VDARLYADAHIQRIYGGTSEMMKEVISGAPSRWVPMTSSHFSTTD
jgi:hypothetical protein